VRALARRDDRSMRPRPYFLEGLLDLHTFGDRDVRRGIFRQSMTSLGLAGSSEGPGPLDGLRPEAIAESVRIALADGLFDDLGWLAETTASVALYEIAAALPLGLERREVGRRVAARLYDGSAATFVAIATRMAVGTGKGLSGTAVRARVALALGLPLSSEVPVDRLALALASRRELAREWIVQPSTGSLPERRLAARLLERAAREAATRAAQGDDRALYPFGVRAVGESAGTRSTAVRDASVVGAALRRLLADREPLVWRHVAVARGLLSGASAELAAEIDAQLSPELSPTEWRRAAASLAARLAVEPDRGLPRARELLESPVLRRDPGVATTMAWGLGPAADAEPEAAEELLGALAKIAPIAIADALVDLRLEVGPTFGETARRACAGALAASLGGGQDDDGLDGLGRALVRDLAHERGVAGELRAAVVAALDAFVEVGAREAHARALAAAAIASETMTALEAFDLDEGEGAWGGMSRRASVGLLRDLDTSLLEAGTLKSLLLLDRRSGDEPAPTLVEGLEARLAAWLLGKETRALGATASDLVHVTFHLRKLRALLHLLDGEVVELGDDQESRADARERWTRACRALAPRLAQERGSPLWRAIAATLARAFDALVREEAADVTDVVLHAARHLGEPDDLEVLAEASTHPDTTGLLDLYARFAREVAAASARAEEDPAAASRLDALRTLVDEMPAEASPRTESLRATLARLTRGLEAIEAAPSLEALAPANEGHDASALAALEEGVARLAQLTAGASQRIGDPRPDGDAGAPRPEAHPLPLAVARVLQDLPDGQEELVWSIGALAQEARARLPPALADVITSGLPRLSSLPARRRRASAPVDASAAEPALPAWLPSRRTLGGFYVQRQLGGGAVGSVFVVTRADERHDPRAERFALKVPDYSATAARSLSEADFLKLFREEAGALLSLPEHPNLARFVTFDAGARPKPILVMELIEGARCDRLVETGSLSGALALALLDGVLAGLEAMHSVGIGHLDLKPANVVLRGGKEPVLVDFGLAGRHIRPGCATGSYGAPEVWGIVPEGVTPTPLAADVYGFGCLAYEVLTGRTLFEAPSEAAMIAAHLVHDGEPPPVRDLASDERGASVARLLRSCLRHDPRDRATAPALRRQLRGVAGALRGFGWPLGEGVGVPLVGRTHR
jgi:hypothetical protein